MRVITAIEKRLASTTSRLALFLTIGGVLLVVGILDLRETQRLLAEGELTRGKVTARHRSGGRSMNYSLDVEFQTRAGARLRSTEDVGASRYDRTKPGDTVLLRYLSSDPSVMKIGARPELDPRGFIMSLGTFIIGGMFYLFGKRRNTLESARVAPNDLDEQHPAHAQQQTLPAQPWLTRLRRRHKLIMVSAVLLGTGAAAFLLPNAPPRGRHEYFLEGQVLSIALDRKEASIEHGAITGLRPATTTSYNVPDAGQLVELKPGDFITATLVVVRDDSHLDDIKKAAAPASRFRADLDPPAQALTEGWERPSPLPYDLYLVPVGDVPAALMSSLVAGVEQTLGIPVTVLSGVSVERTMFDPARSQFIAEQLIAAVRTGHPAVAGNPRARVIAVTAQDMYINARSQWRFASSLRSDENSVAVVSYARMDSAYLGITPDEDLLRSRLRKMIFKNIGMMYYRLPVSRDPRSVLYGNVLDLDDLDYMSEFFEPRS
jgi:predicted Zn-dependent protease